jgi:hypothetical protein
MIPGLNMGFGLLCLKFGLSFMSIMCWSHDLTRTSREQALMLSSVVFQLSIGLAAAARFTTIAQSGKISTVM